MANYKQSEVLGTSWVRSSGGAFYNPYQGVPSIQFNEEELIDLGNGKVVSRQSGIFGAISANFTNPDQEFPTINPLTGEVIGTSKFLDVYVLLHSLYMYLAEQRDIANTPPTPAPVDTELPPV